jgi:outer membrane biosynthesis protein TonB
MAFACGVVKAQTVDHPLEVGGQVKPPIAIQTPEPEFPKGATIHGPAAGWVVALVVDQQGLPQNVRMLRGTGGDADKYIIEAVRQYRFKPATLNGQPVAVYLNTGVYIDPF